MSKKQVLGKGIDSLLASKSFLVSGKTVSTINISDIVYNQYQPRLHFDTAAIQELASSIKQHGLIQPILVRFKDKGYELVAGERRLRATQSLNLTQIPAIVKDISDKEAMTLALVENLDREELSAIEEARGFQRMVDEFGYTHAEIADIFSKSRSAITNTMRLLMLPVHMQDAIMEGLLTEGHGRFLLSITDEKTQEMAFNKILKDKASIRDISDWYESGASSEEDSVASPSEGDVSRETSLKSLFKSLEKTFKDKRNLNLKFKGSIDKGKVVLSYKSEDELELIMSLLK